jgi:hypothetical protein
MQEALLLTLLLTLLAWIPVSQTTEVLVWQTQ